MISDWYEKFENKIFDALDNNSVTGESTALVLIILGAILVAGGSLIIGLDHVTGLSIALILVGLASLAISLLVISIND